MLSMERMEQLRSITDQTDALLSLASHLASIEAKGVNMVLSPLSIHVILSIIATGSSGATRDQVLHFLRSNSSDDLNKLWSHLLDVFADGGPIGGPQLSFANGMWVQQTLTLKPPFNRVVKDVYKAACEQVDFLRKADEVTTQVNTWVEELTNGLIKELLPPKSVDNGTTLIFTNALYFKGTWGQKFDESKTREDDFHLLNGSSVKVPFMTTTKKQMIRTCNGFKVLGLPYEQGEDNREFFMYIFLPNSKDGLPALMDRVRSQPGFLNQHLPFGEVEVGTFKLPRFKISFEFEVSKVLKGLGVELPFHRGGLTEMVDAPLAEELYVSSIFHKSYVEVNEEGTVAAAASTVAIRLLCYTPKVDFVADHPFIFVIRENVIGAVLFVGHVMNPLDS